MLIREKRKRQSTFLGKKGEGGKRREAVMSLWRWAREKGKGKKRTTTYQRDSLEKGEGSHSPRNYGDTCEKERTDQHQGEEKSSMLSYCREKRDRLPGERRKTQQNLRGRKKKPSSRPWQKNS